MLSFTGRVAYFQLSNNINTGCDLASAFSNPLFIDTEVFDFQLQSTSPCIDTGDPAYTPAENELDFNHNPRKVGACIDKGAYEKQ